MATLRKYERIKLRDVFRRLYEEGTTFNHRGVLFVLLLHEAEYHPGALPRAAFTVGKRHYRLAVHRNYIRRRMREAYRLQKMLLKDWQVDVHFIYVSRYPAEFPNLFRTFGEGLKRIRRMLEDHRPTQQHTSERPAQA